MGPTSDLVLPAAPPDYGAARLVDLRIRGAASPEDPGDGTPHTVWRLPIFRAGIVELLRAFGKRPRAGWRFALRLVLSGFHARREAAVPQPVPIAQRRIFGGTLWLAAAAGGVAELRVERTRGFAPGGSSALSHFGMEMRLHAQGRAPIGHGGLR